MKITIAGLGGVGTSLCATLAEHGHDITVVDIESANVQAVANIYDVYGVEGHAGNASVLKKANADKADLFIAVTSSDEINILACSAAKKLGAKHTVARVRNPEYSELISIMKNELGLALTINPELALAKELSRMLRYPSATKMEFFSKGRIELAEMIVGEDSPMCGVTLNDLRSRLNIRFLVCAVLRDGVPHIPSGFFKIEAGDIISVTAPDREIVKLFKALGIYKHPVRNVLVFGASRTAYYLVSLLASNKIEATVIDKNKELCKEFAEQFDCNAVCDDGSRHEVLLENGLKTTDSFLALSDIDEENAVVSMFAKSVGTPKVITAISNSAYFDLFKNVGIDSIVSAKFTTAEAITHYIKSMANIKGSEIESLHRIMDDKVEALEFVIKEEIHGLTDIPLKSLVLKSGILIAAIVHNDKVIIPGGNDVISNGDTVIVVTTQGQIEGIKEIIK